MKKLFIIKFFLYLCLFIASTFFFSCSGDNSDKPQKKLNTLRRTTETNNIYNVLDEYKGLENFFTYGKLEINDFEKILFGDFLGKDSTADLLVSMIEMFPHLIDTGTYSVQIFSSEVQAEVESKGPFPDLVSTISALTENMVTVENQKIKPFYDYLDKLNFMGKDRADTKSMIDIIFDILIDFTNYLKSQDEESVNLFMHYLITDLKEMELVEDGNLDFVDIETLIEKFTIQAPEGMVEILEGLKSLFYDKQFKNIFAELFNHMGEFFSDKNSYWIIKELRLNILEHYNSDSLGELFDRMWTKGPKVGPEIAEMGIENYGKDGKAELAILDMLKIYTVLSDTLEVFYNFQKMGAEFDKFDEMLSILVTSDPFCQDRKGKGEFGNGEFYEPSENLSYKNFSWLNGLFALVCKLNCPTNLTMPFLFESDEKQKETKKILKSIIPDADNFPISSVIHYALYEKDPRTYLGSGKPAAPGKNEYGIKIDDVLYIPVPPDIPTFLDILFYMLGYAFVYAPYDNIYDNLNYAVYDAEIILSADIVQVSEYIPVLKNLVLPFFKLAGIKQLNINFGTVSGANGLLNLELKSLIKDLPANLSNGLSKANMPEWMVNAVIDIINKYLPLGDAEGPDRIYLFPKYVRDITSSGWSLAYFDPDSFHLDRYLDPNPEIQRLYYDTSNFTYEKDKDKANHILNVFAVLCVSAYNAYDGVMAPYTRRMADKEERQAAALDAWGTYFPYDTVVSGLSVLSEISSEESFYDMASNEIMPVLQILEPLISMESHGVVDKVLALFCELGKPELKVTREKIFGGLAKVLNTVDRESKAPYTCAASIINNTQKAIDDPIRWDNLAVTMKTFANILSSDSSFEIINDVIGLLDFLASIDISDEDWSLASEAIVEILGKSAEDKIFTRGALHITTILDEIDKYHIWKDVIDVGNEMIIPGGLLSYLLRGMERDPEYSWEDIVLDINKFLHSDLMKEYSEGSFWKDIYYLFNFLADSIQTAK